MASSDTTNMEATSNDAAGSSARKSTPQTASGSDGTDQIQSQPICLIVLGMAGSGKTSFVERLIQMGNLQNSKMYGVNLDPACAEVPYHANIGKFCCLSTTFFHVRLAFYSNLLQLNRFFYRYSGYSKL